MWLWLVRVALRALVWVEGQIKKNPVGSSSHDDEALLDWRERVEGQFSRYGGSSYSATHDRKSVMNVPASGIIGLYGRKSSPNSASHT